MKNIHRLLLPTLVIAVVGAVAATQVLEPQAPARPPMASMQYASHFSSDPFVPLNTTTAADPERSALGRRLFHEPRLSQDGKVSCAYCHDLARGGVDGLPRSVGVGGRVGSLNTPTVYNSGLNFAQYWDGRARTLEDLVEASVSSPLEMGSGWDEVIGRLRADRTYAAAFSRLYPDGLTPANARAAIAGFVRSLETPSRFDRWLLGDKAALNADETAGFELFKRYGCAACHQGMNIGGNMYEKIGIMGDYFKDRGGGREDADLGRYRVTHRDDHRNEFKVPSLRNVALTAPYFHDGNVQTLEQAIVLMGRYQLGYDIPGSDVLLIAGFLRSLSGEGLLVRQQGTKR